VTIKEIKKTLNERIVLLSVKMILEDYERYFENLKRKGKKF